MIVPVGTVVVLLCLFSAAAGLCFSQLNFQSLIKPWSNKPAKLWSQSRSDQAARLSHLSSAD